jgi:hypothetical protein
MATLQHACLSTPQTRLEQIDLRVWKILGLENAIDAISDAEKPISERAN